MPITASPLPYIQLAEKNVPIDLMFQSIAGTQLANEGFGISLDLF
jgi:ethanolamine ammonia-lyase large subunit